VALTDLPRIKPSKGTVFFMAVFLATFTFFFTRSQPRDNPTARGTQDSFERVGTIR
jgi:hypothetical protein